jgi:hypothetical protein
MADDRIDWADVAALGAYGKELAEWDDSGPVRAVLGRDGSGWLPLLDDIASALREAFEAGQREARDDAVCDACGERHLTSRGAEMRDELRALRRELARWEAVAKWLGEDCDRALGGYCDGFEVIEWLDVREYRTEARAPTIPALAAALGLEVEDE